MYLVLKVLSAPVYRHNSHLISKYTSVYCECGCLCSLPTYRVTTEWGSATKHAQCLTSACVLVCGTHTYFDLRELSLRAVVKVQVPNVCTNVWEGALDVGRSVLMYLRTYNTYTIRTYSKCLSFIISLTAVLTQQ